MTALYHDIDPFVCRWTENSIKAGVIAPGDVVCGDIRDLKPEDLTPYAQVHLFAGLGLWSVAVRRTPIADSERLWTASCPCPPFSAAGKKKACPDCSGTNPIPCPRRTGYFICCLCGHAWLADERHLWPEVWRLARDARPPVIYGEQVASSDGRVWLSSVRSSLDLLGYAFGAEDTCLPRFGAPDIRQRLYWVADLGVGLADANRWIEPGRRIQGPGEGAGSSDGKGRSIRPPAFAGPEGLCATGSVANTLQSGRTEGRSVPWDGPPTCSGGGGELAHAESERRAGRADDGDGGRRERTLGQGGAAGRMEDANGERQSGVGILLQSGGPRESMYETAGRSGDCSMGDPERSGRAGRSGIAGDDGGECTAAERTGEDVRGLAHANGGVTGDGHTQRGGQHGQQPQDGRPGPGRPVDADALNECWRTVDWIFCTDERWRPVRPGSQPLVVGRSGRIGALRAYGNAISWQAACAFIRSHREARADLLADTDAG